MVTALLTFCLAPYVRHTVHLLGIESISVIIDINIIGLIFSFGLFFPLTLDDDIHRVRPFGQPLCLTSDDYGDYNNDIERKTSTNKKK